MTATFQSLRETRLPKAEKAVGLLKNLVRYDHAEHEAKDLVNDLYAAVDEVDAKFAKKWGWKEEEPALTYAALDPDPDAPTTTPASRIPTGTAEGGASFLSEVNWALDAIKRGDKKLAEDRLKRVLKGE